MPESWRPTASRAVSGLRAAVNAEIRAYFDARGVMEVGTPLLASHGATDPTVENIEVVQGVGRRFLQTSPESAMKRLLAAGYGDIYQICSAFRGDETGSLHLPEFQLVEWYRLGFDHHRLMDDVQSLVERILPGCVFSRRSYAEMFHQCIGLDPHEAASSDLALRVTELPVSLDERDLEDRAMLLDILFSQVLTRALADSGAVFIYDFPVEHAAYARIRDGDPIVAERFELIVDGMELANGYHEVTDADEQTRRCLDENALRRRRGLSVVEPDPYLRAALSAGLPRCAGVALGLDRLIMLRTGAKNVADVVSFG